jgi:hypothetical protein
MERGSLRSEREQGLPADATWMKSIRSLAMAGGSTRRILRHRTVGGKVAAGIACRRYMASATLATVTVGRICAMIGCLPASLGTHEQVLVHRG